MLSMLQNFRVWIKENDPIYIIAEFELYRNKIKITYEMFINNPKMKSNIYNVT